MTTPKKSAKKRTSPQKPKPNVKKSDVADEPVVEVKTKKVALTKFRVLNDLVYNGKIYARSEVHQLPEDVVKELSKIRSAVDESKSIIVRA